MSDLDYYRDLSFNLENENGSLQSQLVTAESKIRYLQTKVDLYERLLEIMRGKGVHLTEEYRNAAMEMFEHVVSEHQNGNH